MMIKHDDNNNQDLEAIERERECREWKLLAIDPHDRDTWRSGVRSAMRAASQLPGGGALMWILPLYLHINKKSDDDDDDAEPSFWKKIPLSVLLAEAVTIKVKSENISVHKNGNVLAHNI